jgi:hypothetical protein
MLLKIMLFFFVIIICASVCHFFLVLFLQRRSFRFTLIAFLLSLLIYVSLFFVRPVSVFLSDTFMLLFAASICVLIGRSIKTTPSIVSFSITASIADIVSFNLGPTHYLMKAGEQLDPASLLNLLAFSIVFKGNICSIVGIGDFIIIGIYFIALRQIGIGLWMQFIIPTVGLLGALVVGVLVGGIYAIPFMAATVIGYLFFSHRLSSRVSPC